MNDKKKSQDELGDCFTIAGRQILNNYSSKDLVLVHGLVIGHGALHGVYHRHAWVEKDDQVIDCSTGKEIILPKEVFYALGRIEVIFRYSQEEALKKMLDYGFFGPWEEVLKNHI